MTVQEQIIEALDDVPEEELPRVLEFVRDRRLREAIARSPLALMGDSSWGKDWLTPEEDEAWAWLNELGKPDPDDPYAHPELMEIDDDGEQG